MKNHIPYTRTKIRCIETGVIYEGVVHAAKMLGCKKAAICNHLYGRFPSIRGVRLERIKTSEERTENYRRN